MTNRTEPAWWTLYLGIGLLALIPISKIIVALTPHEVTRALNDPTTVWFTPADIAGRACKDMANEAKHRGGTHWVCLSYDAPKRS